MGVFAIIKFNSRKVACMRSVSTLLRVVLWYMYMGDASS